MKIKAIADHIIFQFLDETMEGYFQETTSWGFKLGVKDHEASASSPRWGKVLSKGPDCPDFIREEQYILIEPLMWTKGVDFEDTKVWMTTTEKVLAMSEEIPK